MPLPGAGAPILRAVPAPLLIGAAGGGLLSLTGLPLAWMLGSLAATAIAGRLRAAIAMPRIARDALVPVIGVLIGSTFTQALLGRISDWPLPLAAAAAYTLAIVALGLVYFRHVAGYDRMTAFFAALPGGLSDLILVGADRGADLPKLALVHIARIVTVVSVLPGVLTLAGPARAVPGLAPVASAPTLADWALLAACAVAGSWLGRHLRVPAHAVMGPMLLSAALHVSGIAMIATPRWLVILAQIVLGAYIGARVARIEAGALRGAVLHGVVWAMVITSGAVGYAALAASAVGLPFASLLLGIAPGGLAEMAVLTLALGVDVAFMATAHLLRLILVYVLTALVLARR